MNGRLGRCPFGLAWTWSRLGRVIFYIDVRREGCFKIYRMTLKVIGGRQVVYRSHAEPRLVRSQGKQTGLHERTASFLKLMFENMKKIKNKKINN